VGIKQVAVVWYQTRETDAEIFMFMTMSLRTVDNYKVLEGSMLRLLLLFFVERYLDSALRVANTYQQKQERALRVLISSAVFVDFTIHRHLSFLIYCL
jgi:hypothetical protein